MFLSIKKITKSILEQIDSKVIKPTIKGIRDEDFTYRGILFIGLMITASGPKVIEYNVRFGDPECQTLLRNLDTDLISIFSSCIDDKLSEVNIIQKERASVVLSLLLKVILKNLKKILQ